MSDRVRVPFDAKPFRIPNEWDADTRERGLNQIAADFADALRAKNGPEFSTFGAVASEADRRAFLVGLLERIQSIDYHADPDDGFDYWQGVGYTLTHGGDCEDLAALFVAFALASGFFARVKWIAQPWAPLNHVTAQVQVRPGEWLWAESTVRGARLGEDPFAAVLRTHEGGGKDGLGHG